MPWTLNPGNQKLQNDNERELKSTLLTNHTQYANTYQGGKTTKKKKKKKKKKKSNVLSFAAALILRSRKDVDEADAGFFGFHNSSSSSSTTDLLSHKLPLLTETQWLKIVLVVVVLQDHQAKDSLAPFLAFKEESWSPPAAKARLATEELDTMSAIEEGGAWPHTPKNTNEGEFYEVKTPLLREHDKKAVQSWKQ
jgi:hypothetical protein